MKSKLLIKFATLMNSFAIVLQ